MVFTPAVKKALLSVFTASCFWFSFLQDGTNTFFKTRSVTSLSRRGFSNLTISAGRHFEPPSVLYDSCGILHIYTSTSIFNYRFSEVWHINFVLPVLVKQSDQDEGVHEMTAMSWKLGEGSTERSFTKVYIVEVALSLSLECKRTTLFSNSKYNTVF